MAKEVRLKERQPLMFRGQPTWYDAGDVFEVVEEKEFKVVGKCYKLKYAGCTFDGWQVAKNFEVTLN